MGWGRAKQPTPLRLDRGFLKKGSKLLSLPMVRRRLIWAVALAGFMALSTAAVASAPRPYVRLGGYWIDKHEKYGWDYFGVAPGGREGKGPHGAQRPCIAVSALIREGKSLRVSESEVCYGTPHYMTANSEPLIVTKTVFATDEGAATAFGVAASHAARYLKLTLGDGFRTVRLHELNPLQAQKTHLRPFRHAGFLMRGNWCIEQILVLNKGRNVLWDSGSEECPPEDAVEHRQSPVPLPVRTATRTTTIGEQGAVALRGGACSEAAEALRHSGSRQPGSCALSP